MEINDVLNSDSPKINGSKIDALTVVYTGISPETLTEFIGEKIKWELRDFGRYGYRKSYAFGNINVLFDVKNKDMGVCLELLGQGCDEMRILTKSDSIFYDLLKFEKADKVRLTRIDIAADDFNGFLDMEVIQLKVDRNEVWSNLQDKTVTKGLDKTPGHTIYIGSAKSNCRIRIYDKGAQMKTEYPWIRVELVLNPRRTWRVRILLCFWTNWRFTSWAEPQVAEPCSSPSRVRLRLEKYTASPST